MTTIPLIDLTAQYRAIQEEINEAIQSVLESGRYILGPNVAHFEQDVAEYLGVQHAIGVASGTDSLVLALRALDIGPDDEVIVPAYTFFATAEAVMMVGATPLFVDIDAGTYCLDTRQIESVITERTKAIIPVHLYGHPADMGSLLEVAEAYGLKVIEDNAQALGAEYEGRKTGSLGHIGCLSFFPSKNLGGCGDGGMVVTNDEGVAERVKKLRNHGWREKYYPEETGYNSRLDELQAAILRVKLKYLDAWNDRRRTIAMEYLESLSDLGMKLPCEAPYAKHVYHLFVVGVDERERIKHYLESEGIACAIYYPQPLHLSKPCCIFAFQEGDFPVAERASQETLALPMYPDLSKRQLHRIVTTLYLVE